MYSFSEKSRSFLQKDFQESLSLSALMELMQRVWRFLSEKKALISRIMLSSSGF